MRHRMIRKKDLSEWIGALNTRAVENNTWSSRSIERLWDAIKVIQTVTEPIRTARLIEAAEAKELAEYARLAAKFGKLDDLKEFTEETL